VFLFNLKLLLKAFLRVFTFLMNRHFVNLVLLLSSSIQINLNIDLFAIVGAPVFIVKKVFQIFDTFVALLTLFLREHKINSFSLMCYFLQSFSQVVWFKVGSCCGTCVLLMLFFKEYTLKV
jgi:hypothetical protein